MPEELYGAETYVGPETGLVDVYLRELDRFARHWGGAEYVRRHADGVEVRRRIRLRGEESATAVTFNADRIRDDESPSRFYTSYVLEVEVSQEIETDELPRYAYENTLEEYGYLPDELSDPDITKQEKHVVRYTIRDDFKYLDRELEVSYLVDDEEVYSFSSEDARYGGGWGEGRVGGEEPEGGGDTLLQSADGDGEEAEAITFDTEGENEVPAAVVLLNEAWNLIEAERGNVAMAELTFDPALLVAMARIQKKLDTHETKLTNLFTLARAELMEVQIQQCRKILRKLMPGAPHSAMM